MGFEIAETFFMIFLSFLLIILSQQYFMLDPMKMLIIVIHVLVQKMPILVLFRDLILKIFSILPKHGKILSMFLIQQSSSQALA